MEDTKSLCNLPKWILVKWADRTRAVINIKKVIEKSELIAHDTETVFNFGDILTIRTKNGLRKGLFTLGSESRQELLAHIDTLTSLTEQNRNDCPETFEISSSADSNVTVETSCSDLSNTVTIYQQFEEHEDESETVGVINDISEAITTNDKQEVPIQTGEFISNSNKAKQTKKKELIPTKNVTNKRDNNVVKDNQLCESIMTRSKRLISTSTRCNILGSRVPSDAMNSRSNELGSQIRSVICSADKKKTGGTSKTCSQFKLIGQTYILMNTQEDSSTTNSMDDLEQLGVDDEFCRSDDDILITNKYNISSVNKENIEPSCSMRKIIRKKKSTKLGTVSNKSDEKAEQDKIPIGYGKTLLPRNVYKTINLGSYKSATRSLLRALFSRETLATHSLTGKRSPAFINQKNRVIKMILKPRVVKDIIKEVKKKFPDIETKLIRNAITTMCSDEAKAWKNCNSKKKLKKSSTV